MTSKQDQMSDDMAKMRRLMELDRRYMGAMFMMMPGRASEANVAELQEIYAGYESLLNSGPPYEPVYTLDTLRKKMADTTDVMARTYSSLNKLKEAKLHYELAAQRYDEIGEREKAAACRVNVAQIKVSDEGDIDDELIRLRTALESVAPNSLPHAQLLLDLGELHLKMSDDDEAEKYLTEAQRELEALGGNPGGANLGDVLAQSLSSIMNGTHQSGSPTLIETQMAMRGCYQRLYLALGQVYKEKDAKQAAAYLAQAREISSPQHNDDLSKRMLEALGGDFGRLTNG